MTRESDLLEHIERRSAGLERGVIEVGPGDDGAVLRLDGSTVLSVDQLVAHRHFDPTTTTLDQIARKSIARSVSDLAAMAAMPKAALAAACLPENFEDADELFDRMAHWAAHWDCPLVGGDIAIAKSSLVLSVTVLGNVSGPRGAVLRSDACAGDEVWVTGALGGSFASGRHLTFEPRLREALAFREKLGPALGAMIDLSDGLGRDGARVARASGVRLEIDLAALPRHDGVESWRSAVGDGEDYELLFTARAGAGVEALESSGLTLTRIGRVLAGEGCVGIDDSGAKHDLGALGWDHGA